MEDHIFGTLITDELKLMHHRARRTGLQHSYAIEPRRPVPDSPTRLTVTVGPDLDVAHMACYYTVDGSQPEGSKGVSTSSKVIQMEHSHVDWDTITWGYAEVWGGEIPTQQAGTLVRYRIGAWREGQAETFADWPDPKYKQEIATHAHFNDTPSPTLLPEDPALGKNFAFHVNQFQTPDWVREAVFYHIFVDRFYPGNGRFWNKIQNLKDLYGGTLWGVRDKLDYIEELGITAIWLSPTWPSYSYHGYDVSDYRSVAEQFGGDEAMHALVKEAHARGIKIILDLVCNHTSHTHPYFVEAQADPKSKYRDYFIFDKSEIGYRTFFGVRSMPQVNLHNEAAKKWMIDIARFWLSEFEIDGFRLDHANGPGPEFWAEFTAACKEANSEGFYFGEVVEPPYDYLRYAGQLDGLLDFTLNDSIRRTYAFGSYSQEKFDSLLKRHKTFFQDNALVMPTFLDNHDLDRFLFIAGEDKEKLRQAARVQFAQPGPPIIYYGTEIGMSQESNEGRDDGLIQCRQPMIWDQGQDKELFAFYQKLIQDRKQSRLWES